MDGTEIIDTPLNLVQQGIFSPVPILVGTTRDELSFIDIANYVIKPFYPIPTKHFSPIQYQEYIRMAFKENHERVLERYPPSENPEENYYQTLKASTDYVFTCPSQRVKKCQVECDIKLVKEYRNRNLTSHLAVLTKVPEYITIGTN